MLVGREAAIARLEDALDTARAHVSTALVVHGEPGVGKTSLLRHAVALAVGFTVLGVQPLEAEAELAFAGLFGLVRPILPLLDRIPAPQRTALSGALALGPPVPGDRFAVGAATLSLLAEAAEDSPVLVVVDDAQWLDTSSREALLFAGRRLGNEGAVLLLGMRDRDWLGGAGIETLELDGLDAASASVLVDGTGVAVDATVRSRVIDETGGNPLAILEAIDGLSDAELRGTAPITHPLAVGATLEDAYAQQLHGLPEDTQEALLISAVSDTGGAGEILNALAQTGLTAAALEPAEREGLVIVSPDRVAFRHPLIRSAAYHLRDPVARRAAHRAFAAALGDGERAAWHLAAGSAGPDEDVAAQLEAAANGAFARTAYAAAASAYETAALLSPDDGARLQRTIGAGRALWVGGQSQRAAELLSTVVDLLPDPRARADVQQLRGAAMLFTHPVAETYELLVSEANRVEPHDPDRAAVLLSSAALTGMMAGILVDSEANARRAVQAAQPGGGGALLIATIATAILTVVRGDVRSARAMIEPLLDPLDHVDPLSEFALGLTAACQTLVFVEWWDRAETLFSRIVGAARTAGAPSMVTFPLAASAEFELRRGRVAAAYAAATESFQLAAATQQAVESSFSSVTLARVEAVLGHEQSCREHVRDALELARRTGAASIEVYSAAALGLLELSLGRWAQAVRHLEECARLERSFGGGLSTTTLWAADLVEAYVRTGDTVAAEESLRVLEERARETDLRWAQGAAARCRGLLTADGYADQLESAVELFGDDMPFERARTQLALGMRLRRARRRPAARPVLHAALGYFESAGAEPWADQTRAELRAAGETPVESGDGSLRSLTPQELQVALIVSTGATNKEAAAQLFLSEKTVEYHLTNAYRKLGLRSRSELVRRVEGLA